jgi:hypothetical protein
MSRLLVFCVWWSFFVVSGVWCAPGFSLLDVPYYASKSGPWGPKRCGVLIYADGFGSRHAALDDMRLSVGSWWRGTTIPPAGDSSVCVNGLRGGCSRPLWRHFSDSGASYGLVASKCADDGTAAGFLVTPSDRYDLPSVGRAIAALSPRPYLVSGGFSRSLWRRTIGSAHVEFDSSGSTAYGETCEYVSPESMAERVGRAVRLGSESGGSRGFFLVVSDADVDVASHKRRGDLVNRSVGYLRTTMEQTAVALGETCPEAWRLVVVGSHETGGPAGGAAGEHGRHSPSGTPVPVFVAGKEESGEDFAELLTGRRTVRYEEIGQLVAPRLSCGARVDLDVRSERRALNVSIRRPEGLVPGTESYVRHYTVGHHDGHGRPEDDWVGFFYVFFLTLIFVIICTWPLLPMDDGLSWRKKRRHLKNNN